MIKNCQTLDELWNIVDEINTRHFPENNLRPILGDGHQSQPKIMFVFINPTHVNSSSDKNWIGPRYPFLGTKPLWRILHKAGLFDDHLIVKINNSKNWSLELSHEVLAFLKSKSLYLTNIVKWTGQDASLPNSEKINLFLPLLEKEIELVQPKHIVTFGLIPFENITRQKIKLKDYYYQIMQEQKLTYYNQEFNGFKTKIIPCYFPVGRGDPKKAVEILKFVSNL